MRYETTEIVVCHYCSGYGRIHAPDADGVEYHLCTACIGYGRLRKKVIIEFEKMASKAL